MYNCRSVCLCTSVYVCICIGVKVNTYPHECMYFRERISECVYLHKCYMSV